MTAPLLTAVAETENRPKVTVVMPTYDRAEFMRESAQMVLNQTLTDLELIISDDHSTDHTPQVVRELMAADSRVSYHRPSYKGGLNTVVNEGIQRSRGHYIQICHDHDFFHPTMIEKLAGVMDRNSSVVYVHPGRQWTDYLGNPREDALFLMNYPEVSDGPSWRRFMLSRMDSPVTGLSMIRRSALEEAGLFDPDFGPASDVEMWLRLCAYGDVGYVNELLLSLRGREPGHAFDKMNWVVYNGVVEAHRKHLPQAYNGLSYMLRKPYFEISMDLSLLLNYLNSFRHRRWETVREGREFLRENGIFFSRLAGWLL